MTGKTLKSEFIKKATLVSARVEDVPDISAALMRAVQLCKEKAPLKNLMLKHGPPGKVMAAPNLDPEQFDFLKKICNENGIDLVHKGVRRFPGGIDMGLTRADLGISETGTVILNSDTEDTRLSTMLSEIHVVILAESGLMPTALEAAGELRRMIGQPSSYTAFITGPSRTADIERVLALGVHGPLELYIMLITKG